MTRDLLTRRFDLSSEPSLQLTQGQQGLDAALNSFSQTAADPASLAAMTVGSFAFRFARLGFLQGAASSGITRFAPRFLLNGAVNLSALTVEVSAFRGANNLFGSWAGHHPEQGVFDANGWRGTFVDFLALKTMGHLGAGQNIALTHFAQANAMVLGHEASARLGFTPHEEGSYIERLAHAEVTNMAMGAGMSLAGVLTGGATHRIERSIDLRIEALSHRSSNIAALENALGARSPQITAMAAGEAPLKVFEGSVPRLGVQTERVFSEPLRDAARLLREKGEAALREAQGDKYKEAASDVEEAVRLLGFINRPHAEVRLTREARDQMKRELMDHLENRVLQDRAIEEFTVREQELADYFNARLEVGLDDYATGHFTRPRSAWASPGRRVGFLTAGQGADTIGHLRYLYNAYPEARRFIEAEAPALLEISSTHPNAQVGHEIDLMKWIKDPASAPSQVELNAIDRSSAIIPIVTLANFEVVRQRGFDPRELAEQAVAEAERQGLDFSAGATGFSQGVITALAIAHGLTPREAWMELYYQGLSYRESDPGYATRKPMASLSNISLEELRAWAQEITAPEARGGLGAEHHLSINRNTDWTHTVTGTTEALARLQAKITAENQKDNRKGVREIGYISVETEGRFHNPVGMAQGERLLDQYHRNDPIFAKFYPASEGAAPERRMALSMPVYSTFNGENLQGVENPLARSVQDRSTREFDFVQQTNQFIGKADLVIDLGPDSAVGGMARRNLAGTGIRVISFKAETGWSELFTTNPQAVKPGKTYEQPQVVRLPDGTLFIDNRYLRSQRGEAGSFVQIGAMTPMTGPTDTVVRTANEEGMVIGLSSGSWGAELPNAMREVNAGTRGEVATNVNLMAIWKGFGGQVEDTFKTRAEGGNLGIEVTAGLPEDLPGFVNRSQAAGVHHPQLKIGPFGQSNQVAEMLGQNPEMTKGRNGLIVVLEGGEAGGHHAPDNLSTEWAQGYDALREQGVIMGSAGGIATPQEVAQQIVQGPLPGRARPAEVVLVGSVAQNFDVMHTTQAVREANVRATSRDIGDLASQAGGPQHMIMNGYYNRCKRLQAAVDAAAIRNEEGKVTGYREFTAEEKLGIIADLNASETKPYFMMREGRPVELHEMTYAEVLQRWIELSTYQGTMRPPYPEYYNHTFVQMMRVMERTLADRKEHSVASDANFLEVGAAEAQARAFVAALGARANEPIGHELAEVMKNVWHSVGEFKWDGSKVGLVADHFPQRFIYRLYDVKVDEKTGDRKFEMTIVGDYKSGQTQYAIYEQGYSAENLLIQTGTSAADKITEANIPLRRFHEETVRETVAAVQRLNPGARVREVSEPGAEPYEMRDLGRVRGVERLSETTEGERTVRVYSITDPARAREGSQGVDREGFRRALLGQGTGTLRTILDVKYRYDEAGNRVVNNDGALTDLLRVFEPQAGQVVQVVTRPSEVAGGDPVLEAIRVYKGEPSEGTLAVEYRATGDRQAELAIHEHTQDGRDIAFRWNYEVGRHHGYMTRVSERAVEPYETYAQLFQSQAPVDGVFRSEYTVTRGDLDAFRNAVGDDTQAYKVADREGHRMAPLSMIAKMGSGAWTASAFAPIPGGNPVNLRHTRDRVEYLGDRNRWVREGDTVRSEVRILEENTTDTGRVRVVQGLTYLNGELVARSTSEFTTLGHFEDVQGFAERKRNLKIKLDNAFIRAVREQHQKVRGITFNLEANPQAEQEFRFEVTEHEETSAAGQVTSRLNGKIYRGEVEVGTVDHVSTRERGKVHPLLEGAFLKKRTVQASEVANFAPDREPIAVRKKAGQLVPAVYGRASGDINPLHTNPILARKMGMDNIIGQGMWTKSSAMATLTSSPLVNGHPERIHDVDARMLAPVPPGTELTDRVEEIGAVDGRIVVKVTTTMQNPNVAERETQPTITVLELTAKVDQARTAYGRPGQGDQKPGMFSEILADPVGKRVLEEFDAHSRRTYGFSLIEMVQTETLTELSFRPVAGSRRQAPVKHPKHIIHRTEMSQIALYAYYEARDEMMRARQVRQRDGIEIGNSLGEYDIPVASGKIARQHGFDLVYFRGRTMQKFVDPLRDAAGNSPFRMDAVAVIARADAERIVEEVRRDTGKFVQVANHNKPSQITITGEIAAVEEAGRRMDAFLIGNKKIKAGTSVVSKLPIDTPFHSQVLAFGIPEFWRLMDTIPMREGQSLEGRYVPCIHGEVFRVTPEYAERLIQFIDRYEAGTQTDSFRATARMMAERGFDTAGLSSELSVLMRSHRDHLRRYAEALRDGTANRVEAENYFLKIGLVYQFASTVEWVKVQNTVFDPAGPLRAERLIEEGPSSTLKDMESSTAAKEQAHRVALANDGRGFDLVSVGVKADWDRLTRAAQAKAAAPAPKAAEAPKAAAAPAVPVAQAAPAPQAAPSAGGSAAPVADRPVAVDLVAKVLTALARKLKAAEVDPDSTLSSISGGSQNAIPVMNDYLGVEFPGVSLPDNPHKSLKFSELAAAIAGQVNVVGPGPSVKAQFNKRVVPNLNGINSVEEAAAYLQSEWDQLGEGRRLEVVLKMMMDSRPEVGEASLALNAPTDGRAWIDSVVRHYAQTEGLSLSKASERNAGGASAGGGMSVDPAELERMQWTSFASVALRQVMPGVDVAAVEAVFAERARLQGEVDNLQARERNNARLRELLGDNFANTLEPVFSADRVRLVAGNFVDAEMTGWIFDVQGDIRHGRLASVEALDRDQQAKMNRMANRATPRTLAMLRYHRGEVARELEAIAADYPQAQRNIEELIERDAPEAQIDGARAHLESLRAYGQAQRVHMEAWDGVLARLEGLVAVQLPNPDLPGEKLMNPHGPAHPPVFRPDNVLAEGYTRPKFEVRPDGSKHYEEVARPGFGTSDLVGEFRQGGVARRNGVEVEGSPRLEYLSGPNRELVLTAAERVAREGITFQDQLEDGSWSPQVAVFTGASPDSINIENFKAFVAGGGHAVVTTSKGNFNGIVKGTEWGDIPLMEYYERVFHEYRGRGAKLELVNLNIGAPADVTGFVENLRQRQIYPRYLFNYAAWSLKADAHMMTGTYENPGDALATWNVNFVGFERMMGGLAKNMQQDGVTGHRLVVAVPGSPNKGGLPGGEYPKVQAAKEAFMNLWHSDPTLHDNTVMVDHEFGWIRGTNLMADNNNAALPLEQESGIRTLSQAEAGFWTMAGMAPEVLAVAATRPVRYSTEAGFTPLGTELAPTYNRILTDMSGEAEYRRALHEAEEADAKVNGGERKVDAVETQVRFSPVRTPVVHVRATDTPLTVPLHQSVVVVSADRFVSGGDRATTRELFTQAGSVKRLSDEQLMRLATIMGRVEWSTQQGRYVDRATKAGEPINPRGVRERYGDWMDQHVGVRQIEPELNDFDPHHDRWLMKITLGEDRVIENLDRTQLRQLMREGDDAIPMGGDRFRLVKKAGQVEYFWAEAPLDRQVAGQIPTGWDPMLDGFPKAWIAENSRGAALAIRAIAGALASMGLTPEDIERDPILSHRLGLILGTGLGDQRYAAELHTLAIFNDPSRDGAGKPIVEGLTNMPGGKVAMNYLRNYMGPKITNVAACGTTAQSLSIGIMQLITGEADVLIVAGTEAPIGPGSTKRFAEINATQTIQHLIEKGVPEWQAADLVFGILANGFVPGEGAGVAILTRGDIAFERGWSVEGVLVGISNTSGGQSVAAASPDRGPVTRLPYLVDAYGRPFGLNANQLGFHETHGTGTVMGDANDASIAYQTSIYGGRTPGNLYPPNAPKRRAGHTMGESAMDGVIEGLDAFVTGAFSPRDGLQTLNAVVDRQLHALLLGRFGFQVDPARLDAFSFSSYGFGKEDFQGVMLNGARYWHRMVLGNHGRQGWADYQRRNEGVRGRIEDLQGSIRTGRRRLVEMNTAVTRGDATLDRQFDENQRRIADWLSQAGNYQRVMGGGRPR